MANVRSEERDGSVLGNFEKRRDANRSSAFGEKGGDGVGGRASSARVGVEDRGGSRGGGEDDVEAGGTEMGREVASDA
jgi:hypothetical protein